ncbi:palmitoyl-protein thioesterase 1 [Ceratitis capitata]|uniref:palmitoyl-protein thioesterase 1 n=1 Tax=Ceratitis capitata TaxID=7213 RepID=UPI00032A1082|nr:palmitoyl-protein thioesterase 1 [Ceratitis capitata]
MTLIKNFIILLFCYYAVAESTDALPVVLWHGMGDTCCFPFSLGSIKKLIETETNGTYVLSLKIGGNMVMDYESGFFIHPDYQVRYVCDQLAKDDRLVNGYNAIGFSQGGQFLRAVAQRCSTPPMKTLISIGGQHQGVFGLPSCPSLSNSACEHLRKLLHREAYKEWVQRNLVQATYWHDPLNEEEYRQKSSFLSNINNEVFINQTYIDNLNKLEKFVMVLFLNDTIVQPKESQWFGFYTPGQDEEIRPLNQSPVYEDLGLNQLDSDGRLVYLSVEGDHLQMTSKWFIENIIPLLTEN